MATQDDRIKALEDRVEKLLESNEQLVKANKDLQQSVNTNGTSQAEKIKKLQDTVQVVKHGSKEHADLLEASYGFSVDDAEAIIKEREKDPASHPYEEYKQAKAMLAALNAKPKSTSTRKGWRRSGNFGQ